MTRRMIVLSRLAAVVCALLLPLASAKEAAVPARAVVKVAFNKTLKKSILVDGRGFTLYTTRPTTARRHGRRC